MTVRFSTTNNTSLPRRMPTSGFPSLTRTAPFRRLLAGAALTLIGMLAARAHGASDKAEAGPRPALTIPVDVLGFHPQSPSFLVSRLSTNSLDFIDQNHLLLTFRTMGLMKRIDDARPDDEDQSIHALVLELPSGKTVGTADWRMHDHGRYLWPMQNGTFLVRQRDTLYLTDAGLELRPYLQLPARLQGVQPSPDGKLLVVQLDKEKHSAEEHQRLTQQALDAGAQLPREDVSVLVINAATGAVLARTDAVRPVNLPLMADGYMLTLPGKQDHWQLSYLSFSGEKKVFGDVLSTCAPNELAATPKVSLLITCHARTDDHLVQGIDTEGKILWESWWDSNQIWPSYANSRDGSRLAIGRLRATHGVNALDPVGDADIKGELVQVLDPIGGSTLLKISLSPAVSASENFALSPDGKRLAVLTSRAIEVYDVPSTMPSVGEPKKKK